MNENSSRYGHLIKEAESAAEVAFYRLAEQCGPLLAFQLVAGIRKPEEFEFQQPARYISDAYTTAALLGACDEIRNAIEGDGNNAVNRACLAIGTLVAAPWNDLTLEKAEQAIHEALATWTSINHGIYNTMRHALNDGMRQPRPEPTPQERRAIDPLKNDPLKRDPLGRRDFR